MNAKVCYFKDADGHPAAIDPDALAMPYAWLEAPLDVQLTWVKNVSNWRDTDHWLAGRLFGEHAEYRWQVYSDGKLHGVLLTEVSIPDTLSTNASVELFDTIDSNLLLLWGDWIDPGKDSDSNPAGGMRFYAPEIPRILDYPLTQRTVDKQVPCLRIRRYRSEKLGDFMRCVSVELQTLRKES